MTTDDEGTIKHLVISSGGPAGHMMYSALRTLSVKGIWHMKNIRSIYGSSIGSYIAIILALRYEWEVMDDYLIKRPWDKIFIPSSGGSGGGSGGSGGGGGGSSSSSDPSSDSSSSPIADAKHKLGYLFKLYNHHGLFGLKEFTETLRPALKGKDMNTNITFQEFYDKTGIEVHFMVTELNKFQIVDFSYKTHPTQSLVEACYMSCCYPFGFAPIYRDGCCYLDGAIINDYPLNECIRDQKCSTSEILGIKMHWEKKTTNLNEKTSLLQFTYTFFNQLNSYFYENRHTTPIANEVVCISKVFTVQDWRNWVKDESYRRDLIVRGETFANVFLSYRRNFRDSTNVSPMPLPQPPVVEKVPTIAVTPADALEHTPTTITTEPNEAESSTSCPLDPLEVEIPRDSEETVNESTGEDYEVHNNDITMM